MKLWTQLLIIFIITVGIRLPTLLEPWWYGDEGIYLTIGQTLNKGEVLYRDIHDNKPPLIYIVAALTRGDQFYYRALTIAWSIGSVFAVFFILRKLAGDKKLIIWILTGVFILLTSLPTFEGLIGNGELFFILPNLLAILLLLYDKNPFWAGVLFGIAGLFKVPAIFEAFVWPLYWSVTKKPNLLIKQTAYLFLGIFSPLILSVGYFGFLGVLKNYFMAAIGQNFGYVSSWGTPEKWGLENLKVRAVVCGILCLGVLGIKKYLNRNTVFVLIWMILGVFAVLLSGRPYPHYLLQIFGAAVVFVAVWWIAKPMDKIVSLAVVGVLIFQIGFIYTNKGANIFPTYKTFEYYQNLMSYLSGATSREKYFDYFDPNVVNNYKIGEFIFNNTNTDDRVFIWGDQPMIYALAHRSPLGKYTAAYHVKDFRAEKETMELLLKYSPKYIVSFGNENELPGLESLLSRKYLRQTKFGLASIYQYNKP